MKKRIAVVMGGTSHEAEVSLRSGAAVAEALRTAGYEVVEARLTKDSLEEMPHDVDAVFIALHGGYGEGGGIQTDLDAVGLPYTGPGATASRLCMDKPAAKAAFRKAGVPTPESAVVTAAAADFPPPFPLPVVVKPPRDGSSVGLSKVTDAAQWPEAVRLAAAQDAQGEALVERFVAGREWAVGVIGDEALPVLEIVAPNGWYDYHAKYAPGVSKHLYPPEDETTREAQRLAVLAAKATGCRGAVRVDFRLSPEGKLYVLEVNTSPGCTETSLLPDAAARAGIPFPALCARLVEAAQHG